jgi:hypothetical protein
MPDADILAPADPDVAAKRTVALGPAEGGILRFPGDPGTEEESQLRTQLFTVGHESW